MSFSLPRFVLGPPPANPIVESSDWKPVAPSIYGPTGRSFQFGIVVGLTLIALIAGAWKMADGDSLPIGEHSFASFLLAVALLTIGHEGLHLLGFPGAGLDGHSVCGIWLKAGSPFAQYLRPVKRNRFLFFVALPFLGLTLMPLVAHAFSYPVSSLLQWTSVLNSFGAGADLLACALLLREVPREAQVLESNHCLYWRAL